MHVQVKFGIILCQNGLCEMREKWPQLILISDSCLSCCPYKTKYLSKLIIKF